MSYIYKRTEPGLWTVGYLGGDGQFEPESDHGSAREAAQMVAWLNGGGGPEPGTEDADDDIEASVPGVDLVPLIRMVRKEMAEKVAEALECTHCQQIAYRIAKREGEAKS